ncbi:hypothetical protein N9955_00160 [bacterium]|nr:hypothetical protein [bacterium]
MSYEDKIEARNLIQEMVNEQNEEAAQKDPKFAADHKVISEAMEKLTEAGIYAVMFCETDTDPKANMIQYNNGQQIIENEKANPEKAARRAHNAWRKIARAICFYFGSMNPKVHPLMATLHYIEEFANSTDEEWEADFKRQEKDL